MISTTVYWTPLCIKTLFICTPCHHSFQAGVQQGVFSIRVRVWPAANEPSSLVSSREHTHNDLRTLLTLQQKHEPPTVTNKDDNYYCCTALQQIQKKRMKPANNRGNQCLFCQFHQTKTIHTATVIVRSTQSTHCDPEKMRNTTCQNVWKHYNLKFLMLTKVAFI